MGTDGDRYFVLTLDVLGEIGHHQVLIVTQQTVDQRTKQFRIAAREKSAGNQVNDFLKLSIFPVVGPWALAASLQGVDFGHT